MTIRQKIKLNMYLAVRNIRNKFEDTAKKIAKFESSFSALMIIVDQIQQVSEQQGINKKGLTEDKRRLKEQLIAVTFKHSKKLSVLAKSQRNNTLLQEVSMSESDLTNLPGIILRDKCQVIYDRVGANLPALSEHGVTAETQKQFQSTIIDFNNALSMPRMGVAERRQATQKLFALYEQADEAIKILDMVVESSKDEQTDFYNAYKSARKLVDINSGKVSLKASAIDFSSREPLKGVFFRFRPKGIRGGQDEIIKRTADKGGLQVKNMIPGTYEVLISKSGYLKKESDLVISEGERSEMMVELEKEG
jgi:hypothetical protein